MQAGAATRPPPSSRSPRAVPRPAHPFLLRRLLETGIVAERPSRRRPCAPIVLLASPRVALMRRWCPRLGEVGALDERNGRRALRAGIGTGVVGDELDGQRARAGARNADAQRGADGADRA